MTRLIDADALADHLAALAQLKAENEALRREVERLRVCGTCTHQDIDADDDGRNYVPHPFIRYECDCHFPGEDYPEENDWPQGKDWGTAKNHDRCHFTPSRWTERGAE